MKRLRVLTFVLGLAVTNSASASNLPTLADLISIANGANSSIRRARSEADSASARVWAEATPDDPIVGVNTLNRGNETRYGTINQKIRFPVKYYVQAKRQNSIAKSREHLADAKALQIRRELVQVYFAIYRAQKVVELTQANMEAVKEFARVAERKYAAGRAVRADSMKAHFEITRLELDLIRQRQEESALQYRLRALLNQADFPRVVFGSKELRVPKVFLEKLKSQNSVDGLVRENSPSVQAKHGLLEAAEWNSALSKWEFAPDIHLQYQKRISGNPTDSKIYSIGLSVPLFFWSKTAKASAARAEMIAKEFEYEAMAQDMLANVKDLQGKVEVGLKTLEVYKTSLIPQAEGAFNSSRAAYRANKSSFINLLDSERSLYKVKIDYYRSLENFVSHLSLLEENLGFTISNLGESQ